MKTYGYKIEMYGFEEDQTVKTIVDMTDENGVFIPSGSHLRLICFAPKVRIYKPVGENEKKYVDTREYFFNAVRSGQESDFGDRIRANFCTITKDLAPAVTVRQKNQERK